jgi:hypothetical protein
VLILALAACRSHGDLADLGRVSMALRGLRPSLEEIGDYQRGRVSLQELAERWASDPAFGATVRDMHAEQLRIRFDSEPHPPPLGPLLGVPEGLLTASLDEEPLWLIERIVLQDRPYTEILTAPTVVADHNVALAYGLDWDPAGPALQELPWPDGRPGAGILSSTGLWQRHMSSDTNYQRARAKLALETLLCRSFDSDDGVREPSTSADAVRTEPACAACHDTLDPVASAFFGLQRYVLEGEIRYGYATDCAEGFCYPIPFWDPEGQALRQEVGMPAPGYGGAPVEGLAELGARLAEDPAFATCTARRFASWLGQEAEPDPGRIEALAEVLVDSGWSARALAVATVLDPAFLDAPAQLLRPEQLDRLVTQLTGHRWGALPSEDYGPVQLATSDEHGMRALMGGIDGWSSVEPDPGPSPTRELAWRWAMSEAAAHAVQSGRLPAPGTLGPALRELHLQWLLEDKPDLDPDRALFDEVLQRTGDRDHAWTVLLTALLLDDRVVTF